MNLTEMKRESVPLHVEVASLLRNQIMSGRLRAGERLPALSELTEKFGVARMTIRQAMGALQDEGLIERYAGKGTFVRDVEIPVRQKLNMKAELSQLQSMVAQLEVSIVGDGEPAALVDVDGTAFRQMKRTHTQSGEPFCQVDILLEDRVYLKAPDRFENDIVVTVLKDLNIDVQSARQRVTISYADVEIAEALGVPINAPVFRVLRDFFCDKGNLVYSATLIYPGDKLELDIEFTV
jgi:GntR family transcriptional regulator